MSTIAQRVQAENDLRTAKSFFPATRSWHDRMLGKLLHRKYASSLATRHRNWRETGLKDYGVVGLEGYSERQKEEILMKRMLCRDYVLQSRTYHRRVNKKIQKIKCNVCQHQTLQFIYLYKFDGGPNYDVQTGLECANLIESVQTGQKVVLFNHRARVCRERNLNGGAVDFDDRTRRSV